MKSTKADHSYLWDLPLYLSTITRGFSISQVIFLTCSAASSAQTPFLADLATSWASVRVASCIMVNNGIIGTYCRRITEIIYIYQSSSILSTKRRWADGTHYGDTVINFLKILDKSKYKFVDCLLARECHKKSAYAKIWAYES